MKTPAKIRVTKSRGNVFADIGLDDAPEVLLKADLAHRICQLIAKRRLTQTAAAELLDLDQPKISALVRGKLQGFSTERLMRILRDLGQDVIIGIRPTRQAGSRGHIRIAASKA